MKKLLNLLISSKATLVLLVIFTIAIGSATFIEEKYDTTTAKLLIYNAKWFELLLLLLVINFIGSIKRFHLLRIGRLPGLLFHSAFIVVILGAAVTRFFGFEGHMHIRQNETSNFITSADPYISINAIENNLNYHVDKKLLFGINTDNSFQINIKTKQNKTISIVYKNNLKNVVELYKEGTVGGINMVELTISIDGHKDVVFLKDGELKETHGFFIAYNNDSKKDALKIIRKDGKLFLKYPESAIKTSKMPEMTIGQIAKDSIAEFKMMHLYELENSGISFVLSKQLKNAILTYTESKKENAGPDALVVDVSYNGETKEATIIGGLGYVDNFKKIEFNGMNLQIAYGAKKIKLPFEIRLNNFILDRYAGSQSPSSYASEVTLIDKKNKIVENHRIFMNNVLNYKGYRFFQSSYDRDEKGTILSVNHDFYGTWITYFGYLIMTIGFILTLFNKNSRYRDLIHKISNVRKKRKNLLGILIFVFFATNTTFSQDGLLNLQQQNPARSISIKHAKKFGHLIVQTFDGRFAPINTLAYDVMHKISRKDKFEVEGLGKLNAMQVFLDLPINSGFWKQQKIIYVREKAVMSVIGLDGKYASFNDFFNDKGAYKLGDFAETAFRKTASQQNKFDKEIIKINERLSIFQNAFLGNLLNIFPVQNSSNNKWINGNDPLASVLLTGPLKILNSELQLKDFNYRNFISLYFTELVKAKNTGIYSKANKLVSFMENIQRQSNAADLLPTKAKVEKEIEYNESKIFINLKNIYALLSVLLLGFAFIDNLLTKKKKIVTYILNSLIVLLGIAFIYHTYGMGLRWYLSGHAPWSNGYEALILISWASLLAGFSFVRYSKITLAATTLLAFFTLMTASHSSYDPQLTNLVPVLKSYWLIIHVATLTISYGFLGLGFTLGLMNLGLYLFKNNKSSKKIDLIITELSYINEMNLTVGLFLATIGTFLGGVWANESWGRYWGWDAKETWALVIVMVYSIILHFRLVPKMKSLYIFNVGAVVGFGSVLMTFFGVNYYLSKGMHSYASGDTPVFPVWAWIVIISILTLIVAAGFKNNLNKNSKI